ncbi:MAG: SMI1/KNR4 family protein [Phycisphaerae bacterium]
MLPTLDQLECLLRRGIRDHSALPRGATEDQIEQFVLRTGLQVPPSLRLFLRRWNGIHGGEGGLYGIGPGVDEFLDIEHMLRRFPKFWRKLWIPVAGDGCGSYYIVPTRQEFGAGFPVIFCDHVDGWDATYSVASDYLLFVSFCLQRELDDVDWWPFEREQFLREDPEIARFSGVPLPWDADEWWATRR